MTLIKYTCLFKLNFCFKRFKNTHSLFFFLEKKLYKNVISQLQKRYIYIYIMKCHVVWEGRWSQKKRRMIHKNKKRRVCLSTRSIHSLSLSLTFSFIHTHTVTEPPTPSNPKIPHLSLFIINSLLLIYLTFQRHTPPYTSIHLYIHTIPTFHHFLFSFSLATIISKPNHFSLLLPLSISVSIF